METVIDSPKKSANALPAPSPAPVTPSFRQLLPSAAGTSLLLYLCYFPIAWGWLGWVALAPLCALVRSEARGRTVFLAAWVSGLLFFFPALQWMRVADPRMVFTWILLAIYCSLYFPVGVLLTRALDRRRVPLVLALPVVWTALELLRSYVMGGFFWYYLAHSQHDFLPIIQISDVAGGYGVTFLVAAVNAVVFEWAWRSARRPVLVFQSALVLLLFASCLLYGSVRMGQANFEKGPRLALIQGNVEQRIRNDSGSESEDARKDAIREIDIGYKTLSGLARDRLPDLIVYPETSYMKDWDEIITDTPGLLNPRGLELIEGAKKLTRDVAAQHASGPHRPHVLLGLNVNEWFPDQQPPRLRYNSALLVGPEGKAVGRYDKIHRVPFGEYIPLRETLPFMNSFSPYDYDYGIAAGQEQKRLPLGDHRFGVVICYEATDMVLARQYVDPAEGRKADFLINISNDGWFDGTSEHEQHLAICRFRAVETRRSVARSVNMGISAVIDGNGLVLAPETTDRRAGATVWEIGATAESLPVGRWGEFKKVSGVLLASIPIDHRDSLYALWGDWLPWTCAVVLLLALIALRPRPISRPVSG